MRQCEYLNYVFLIMNSDRRRISVSNKKMCVKCGLYVEYECREKKCANMRYPSTMFMLSHFSDLYSPFLVNFSSYFPMSNNNVSTCYPIIRKCLTGEHPNAWVAWERSKLTTDEQRIFVENMHRNNLFNNYIFNFLFDTDWNVFAKKFVDFDFYYNSHLYYTPFLDTLYNGLIKRHTTVQFDDYFIDITDLFSYLLLPLFSIVIQKSISDNIWVAYLPLKKYFIERGLKLYDESNKKKINWRYSRSSDFASEYIIYPILRLAEDMVFIFYYACLLDSVDNFFLSNAQLHHFLVFFDSHYTPIDSQKRTSREYDNYTKKYTWISSPNVKIHICKSIYPEFISLLKLFIKLRIKRRLWNMLLRNMVCLVIAEWPDFYIPKVFRVYDSVHIRPYVFATLCIYLFVYICIYIFLVFLLLLLLVYAYTYLPSHLIV